MEYNLLKWWITVLYTWNLHNIVHQLHLNLKIYKIKLGIKIKLLYTSKSWK